MKKHLLTPLYFLFLFNFCFAQEIEWQNTIGGNNDDYLNTIVQTSDGGYICGGYSYSDSIGDKTEANLGGADIWILKLDSLGNIEWQNTIGGSNDDVMRVILPLQDGGYMIGAHSNSDSSQDKTENSIGGNDYWIFKLDINGNILWQNSIGGNDNDVLSALNQTNDNGFILTGISLSNISGDKTENCLGYYDYWTVKVDSLGNVQWQKTLGASGDDYSNSIAQTSDGGYILGGYRFTVMWNEYNLIKLDSAGNLIWEKLIGGSKNDQLGVLKITTDGGYILGGVSYSNISGDKTENRIGTYDYWIVKTDSLGNIEWQNTIGGTAGCTLYSVAQTADLGYIIGGHTDSDIKADKCENRIGGEDIWAIKIDSVGNIVWQNTIGTTSNDYINSVVETSTGPILGCWTASDASIDKTENSQGGGDFWIIKLTTLYNQIVGKTFLDLNSNSTQDLTEPAVINNLLQETNTGKITLSQQNGFFSVPVLDSGVYVVTASPVSYFNAVPVSQSAVFSGSNQIDSLNDFAFQPISIFNDLCVTITPLGNFRAGMNASYMINYGNYGTTTLSPTVIFFPYFNVSYISSSVTPTSIAPDSVVWALPALAPFQTGSIVVTVNVNTGLPIGTLINSSVRIEPLANDANPTCNNHSWEVYTTGSFDPNDIIVSEDTLLTTQLPTAPWLDYIIRFQNTGNDTAFTAKILNPIDTFKLDLSSFEFINASHPVNLNWINYQRNMEFKFENILLPDSNINEPMSHGFVHYRIKPKTTLVAGDSITNFAAIYFDFNAPVITNTATTRIVLPTGFAQLATGNGQLAVYPNPAGKELTVGNIQLAKNNSIKVFDLYGRVVFEKLVSSANCTLQIANWPSGIYFIQAGTLRGKFVKE